MVGGIVISCLELWAVRSEVMVLKRKFRALEEIVVSLAKRELRRTLDKMEKENHGKKKTSVR